MTDLRKWQIVVLALCLLVAGCADTFEYHLVAKGNVTHIEIIGGNFFRHSKRILYLDDGYVCALELYGKYKNIKIGDYIYIYHRKNWGGRMITKGELL